VGLGAVGGGGVVGYIRSTCFKEGEEANSRELAANAFTPERVQTAPMARGYLSGGMGASQAGSLL